MKVNRQKLQLAMASECLTSSELLEKSGMPRGTFMNVIVGKNVKPATAGKIARALGVPVESIIDMEDL